MEIEYYLNEEIGNRVFPTPLENSYLNSQEVSENLSQPQIRPTPDAHGPLGPLTFKELMNDDDMDYDRPSSA